MFETKFIPKSVLKLGLWSLVVALLINFLGLFLHWLEFPKRQVVYIMIFSVVLLLAAMTLLFSAGLVENFLRKQNGDYQFVAFRRSMIRETSYVKAQIGMCLGFLMGAIGFALLAIKILTTF